MELARLDFQQLRVKHIFFKSKVRTVLYGGGYDQSFFTHNNPVTLWFSAASSAKYQAEPEMQQLYKLHRSFVQLANNLVSKYQDGQIEQSHSGMTELNEMSEHFLSVLSDLEKRYLQG